jgi:hypothetical protein
MDPLCLKMTSIVVLSWSLLSLASASNYDEILTEDPSTRWQSERRVQARADNVILADFSEVVPNVTLNQYSLATLNVVNSQDMSIYNLVGTIEELDGTIASWSVPDAVIFIPVPHTAEFIVSYGCPAQFSCAFESYVLNIYYEDYRLTAVMFHLLPSLWDQPEFQLSVRSAVQAGATLTVNISMDGECTADAGNIDGVSNNTGLQLMSYYDHIETFYDGVAPATVLTMNAQCLPPLSQINVSGSIAGIVHSLVMSTIDGVVSTPLKLLAPTDFFAGENNVLSQFVVHAKSTAISPANISASNSIAGFTVIRAGDPLEIFLQGRDQYLNIVDYQSLESTASHLEYQ